MTRRDLDDRISAIASQVAGLVERMDRIEKQLSKITKESNARPKPAKRE